MPAPTIRPRPHLRQEGATYLVSWELHPAQPPLTEAERGMVMESVRHFDGTKYDLIAVLALAAKIYAVVTPYARQRVGRLAGSWKRWLFGLDGRSLPLWRRGYFDRIMRGPEEVGRRIQQLRGLPGPLPQGTAEFEWLWLRGEGRREAGQETGTEARVGS